MAKKTPPSHVPVGRRTKPIVRPSPSTQNKGKK